MSPFPIYLVSILLQIPCSLFLCLSAYINLRSLHAVSLFRPFFPPEFSCQSSILCSCMCVCACVDTREQQDIWFACACLSLLLTLIIYDLHVCVYISPSWCVCLSPLWCNNETYWLDSYGKVMLNWGNEEKERKVWLVWLWAPNNVSR